MEISYGNKPAIKMFKAGQCISIGIPKDNLEFWVDSIGYENQKPIHNTWYDISGGDKSLDVSSCTWLQNGLLTDGKTSDVSIDLETIPEVSAFIISFRVPPDGGFCCTYPGMGNIYTINNALYIHTGSTSAKVATLTTNKFYNMIIIREIGKVKVYLNGSLSYTFNTTTSSNNSYIRLGYLDSKFYKCIYHSIAYYTSTINESDVTEVYALENNRYNYYYNQNLLLDLRGYQNLIKYGGDIRVRDNSIKRNHPSAVKFIGHNHRRRCFEMVGINYIKLQDRYNLLNSFTIEFLINSTTYFMTNRYLLKKGDTTNGIEVLLSINGLLINIYKDGVLSSLDYTYDYTNKRTYIGITYDKKTFEFKLYVNGARCKSANIEYKSNIDESQDVLITGTGNTINSFIGKLYTFRMYDECLSSDILFQNYTRDMEIYYA